MHPLFLLVFLPVDPPGISETPKPVAVNRQQEKEFLEKHKQARPRLPMPPEGTGPLARVNNGRFRQFYLPPEFQQGGLGSREPDPDLILDNTFKVKLFWITSRANNCYYCLGHQEHKLMAAGVTDDGIAALDSDWTSFTPAEVAAYEFTRKLTFEPHKIGPEDIAKLGKHYNPKQILEMTITVAGFNSMNRWTDGLNIPAEENGNFFRKEGGADLSSFQTPTSDKFAKAKSIVAPFEKQGGDGAMVAWPKRPELESPAQVRESWANLAKRKPVLPIADKLPETWTPLDHPPHWALLLATFPKSGKARYEGVRAVAEKGQLSPKLKAAIAWAAARQDRAWYALAVARKRLLELGLTDEQIFGLDHDASALESTERSALSLARKLAAAPATVTDKDIEDLRKSFSDKQVAEIVHHVCNAAFFNRVTETAALPLD